MAVLKRALADVLKQNEVLSTRVEMLETDLKAKDEEIRTKDAAISELAALLDI